MTERYKQPLIAPIPHFVPPGELQAQLPIQRWISLRQILTRINDARRLNCRELYPFELDKKGSPVRPWALDLLCLAGKADEKPWGDLSPREREYSHLSGYDLLNIDDELRLYRQRTGIIGRWKGGGTRFILPGPMPVTASTYSEDGKGRYSRASSVSATVSSVPSIDSSSTGYPSL